eukprot:SAG11_NODE_528_length_8722_cov_5.291198_9_plen_50_part_00
MGKSSSGGGGKAAGELLPGAPVSVPSTPDVDDRISEEQSKLANLLGYKS